MNEPYIGGEIIKVGFFCFLVVVQHIKHLDKYLKCDSQLILALCLLRRVVLFSSGQDCYTLLFRLTLRRYRFLQRLENQNTFKKLSSQTSLHFEEYIYKTKGPRTAPQAMKWINPDNRVVTVIRCWMWENERPILDLTIHRRLPWCAPPVAVHSFWWMVRIACIVMQYTLFRHLSIWECRRLHIRCIMPSNMLWLQEAVLERLEILSSASTTPTERASQQVYCTCYSGPSAKV